MDLKENTGAAFKNDKKGNDKAPEYKGAINVDGTEKQIALWVSESKKGTKYFSIKISDAYKPENLPQAKDIEVQESDDLPF